MLWLKLLNSKCTDTGSIDYSSGEDDAASGESLLLLALLNF